MIYRAAIAAGISFFYSSMKPFTDIVPTYWLELLLEMVSMGFRDWDPRRVYTARIEVFEPSNADRKLTTKWAPFLAGSHAKML